MANYDHEQDDDRVEWPAQPLPPIKQSYDQRPVRGPASRLVNEYGPDGESVWRVKHPEEERPQ